MSSACMCHIDPNKCLWCKTKVYFSTFGAEDSQGVAINLPDGRTISLHTENMTEAHDLADALNESVVDFDIE